VLNYAPGPLKTDMVQRDVLADPSADGDLKAMFRQLEAEGSMLAPEQSAQVLARVLAADEFASGDHVDYHDVKEFH